MCCNQGIQRALKWHLVRLIRLCAVIKVNTVINNRVRMDRHMRFWYLSHMYGHSLNMHTQIASGARGLKFGLSLHLLPYFELLCKERDNAINIQISCAGSKILIRTSILHSTYYNFTLSFYIPHTIILHS